MIGEEKQTTATSPVLSWILQKNPWISLSCGIAVGVFLHYVIFRLSLPTEPFIYAAF